MWGAFIPKPESKPPKRKQRGNGRIISPIRAEVDKAQALVKRKRQQKPKEHVRPPYTK